MSFILSLGKKIPKIIAKNFKKLKNLFPALCLAKTGWDRPRKWKKKNCSPEFFSYPIRPRKLQKKNRKKIQKIKKLNSGIISIQNRLKKAGKERKKFQSQIPKKIVKKVKKLKNLFPALFLAKTGWYKLRKRKKF